MKICKEILSFKYVQQNSDCNIQGHKSISIWVQEEEGVVQGKNNRGLKRLGVYKGSKSWDGICDKIVHIRRHGRNNTAAAKQ